MEELHGKRFGVKLPATVPAEMCAATQMLRSATDILHELAHELLDYTSGLGTCGTLLVLASERRLGIISSQGTNLCQFSDHWLLDFSVSPASCVCVSSFTLHLPRCLCHCTMACVPVLVSQARLCCR